MPDVDALTTRQTAALAFCAHEVRQERPFPSLLEIAEAVATTVGECSSANARTYLNRLAEKGFVDQTAVGWVVRFDEHGGTVDDGEYPAIEPPPVVEEAPASALSAEDDAEGDDARDDVSLMDDLQFLRREIRDAIDGGISGFRLMLRLRGVLPALDRCIDRAAEAGPAVAKLSPEQRRDRAIELRERGLSYKKIARQVGANHLTVGNWCREAGQAEAAQ